MHYRVKNVTEGDGVRIVVERWSEVRETPKGFWVCAPYCQEGLGEKRLRELGYLKFVLKDSTRRYCYPTLAEAMTSFKARKNSQFRRLDLMVQSVELALSKFEDYAELPPEAFDEWQGLNIGTVPAIENFAWGD